MLYIQNISIVNIRAILAQYKYDKVGRMFPANLANIKQHIPKLAKCSSYKSYNRIMGLL